MHFTRQAVEVIVNEKKVKSAPVIIAPIMLVATNSIAKRITASKIVPSMPVRITDKIGHMQLRLPLFLTVTAIRITARYTTAIPKTTHKNGAVTVITALKRRNAVIIPIIILAIIANPAQFVLQSQLILNIFITPTNNICLIISEGENKSCILIIVVLEYIR